MLISDLIDTTHIVFPVFHMRYFNSIFQLRPGFAEDNCWFSICSIGITVFLYIPVSLALILNFIFFGRVTIPILFTREGQGVAYTYYIHINFYYLFLQENKPFFSCIIADYFAQFFPQIFSQIFAQFSAQFFAQIFSQFLHKFFRNFLHNSPQFFHNFLHSFLHKSFHQFFPQIFPHFFRNFLHLHKSIHNFSTIFA